MAFNCVTAEETLSFLLVFEKTSLHFVLSFVHQYSRLHCILLNEFDYEPKQVKSLTENAGPEASRVIL